MAGISRIGVVTSALLVMSLPVAARQEPAAPNLTRAQRNALQSLVAAVETAASGPDTPGVDWPIHVLRASDGSHYVAFSLVASAGLVVDRPVALYVRLATRRDEAATTMVERSAVAEWLAGQRSLPLRPERAIAFGDMPTYGAGSAATRAQPTQDLRLLEMQRERARERREAREREHKAALEGEAVRAASPLLPFEDFDLQAVPMTVDASGAAVLRRSLTAGPGNYVLTVAWMDPAVKNAPGAVSVVKRRLDLPVASTSQFALSSVIVADAVNVREVPLRGEEQSGHPYSIGTIEIKPARDTVLTNDERLALVVQVINPRSAADGKPDVAVGFRMFRRTASGQEHVGVLNPQIYNQVTLPPDFDVMKGHPIFAAVAVPLHTFKRGAYRIQIMADDRLAGVSATAEADFSILGTPALLLRDAPPLGPPFRREALLEPAIVDAMTATLGSAQASPALTNALAAARERRFIDLLRDEGVRADEQGPRAALRALALYALGDTSTAVASALRQALESGAAAAAAHLLIGASRALEGNDREAVAAWQTAMAGGIDSMALNSVLMDAYLRQGDNQRASDLGIAALAVQPSNAGLIRRLAASHIAGGRLPAALTLLDTRLQQDQDDQEAQWLLLHALFAGFVTDDRSGADAAGRERFRQLARQYIDTKGRHAALAAEWLAAVP
jgi:tetratricopeptide (TPR) repeat protein